MKIEVTQEDIDGGIKCSGLDCPVARAIRRVHPIHGAVVSCGLYWVPGTGGKRIRLPDSALRFYRDFDTDQKVEPFSFDLPIEL